MSGSAAEREFNRYLDAILEFTRQADSRELLAALLRVLKDSIQARHASLFALSSPEHETEFDAGNIEHAVITDLFDDGFGPARPLRSDADLLDCVCSRTCVVRDTPDGRRLVFPVFGRRHVRALLALDLPRNETVPPELLTKLLQVYSNQTLTLARGSGAPPTGERARGHVSRSSTSITSSR